jgi:hypothetical protein
VPIIYDLLDESGPAEIKADDLSAAEMIERDPKRYVRTMPPNVKLGPKRGFDRIVL